MRSSEKSLDELYLKVARSLEMSKYTVKDIVDDIFSFSREYMRKPTSPALMLNNLGTIEANAAPIHHMIKNKSTLTEEERIFWEEFLDKVKEYHSTKKIENKQKNVKTLHTEQPTNWEVTDDESSNSGES